MKYLILSQGENPFLTSWFEYENHWRDGVEMTVINLVAWLFTKDGKTWEQLEFDKL